MAYEDSLLKALLESSRSSISVDGAFENLLEEKISIRQGTRELASKSQKHLREFLSTQAQNDGTFPRVLSIKDDEFIGGSFARRTKHKPLDDIDLYVPLDGHGLSYLQGGVRLPYTVISDGVLSANPVLNYRWMDGSYVSSKKLVNEFATVLKGHYQKTLVRPDEQAVRIEMESGLGFDVVPCFSLKPDSPDQYQFYLIPNGKNGWIRTNPKIDTQVGEQIHKVNAAYRKAIRLVKYWNSTSLNNSLLSYYIELAIMRAILTEKRVLNQISYGVAFGFWAISQAVTHGNLTSWLAERLPDVPPVQPGVLTEHHLQQISLAALGSRNAWEFEQSNNLEEAIRQWRLIFGDSFGR